MGAGDVPFFFWLVRFAPGCRDGTATGKVELVYLGLPPSLTASLSERVGSELPTSGPKNVASNIGHHMRNTCCFLRQDYKHVAVGWSCKWKQYVFLLEGNTQC